jgi:hypothetical protein
MGNITIAGTTALEDNSSHTNRFEISSESSNRIYIVAQAKSTGEWQCSCPGWCIKRAGKERNCKHLKALLPILLEAESVEPKKLAKKAVKANVPRKPAAKKRKMQVGE